MSRSRPATPSSSWVSDPTCASSKRLLPLKLGGPPRRQSLQKYIARRNGKVRAHRGGVSAASTFPANAKLGKNIIKPLMFPSIDPTLCRLCYIELPRCRDFADGSYPGNL